MISKVFHLADLHIRKGNVDESRFDEYFNVFENCIDKIESSFIKESSIAVVCGDIFHHKLQISSNGIILFNFFISKLASLMPIFIIQGNHDLIQENADNNNDLIKAILTNTISNVYYINETGNFVYQNINFGMVSIKDILKKHASSGLTESLPPFPEPKPGYCNIALSHCTVKNSNLHNYTKSLDGIPLEWFKGYDIAMLGDIHLQSTKYNKTNNLYYGYPGSLVQQDFGESLFNHGFLEWNIDTISVCKHHVFNKVGRVNVKLDNEILMINAKNYIPFSEFLLLCDIPSNLVIRLYVKTDIDKHVLYIKSKLQELNISCTFDVKYSNFVTPVSTTTVSNANIDISELNSNKTIIEFFKKHTNNNIYERNADWRTLFTNYDSFLLDENLNVSEVISDKILQKNQKLRKHTDSLVTSHNDSKNVSVFTINEVQFDWILSFGKANKFVFDKGKIILVNAPNGYGKSAFLECIMIGLFGESIPSRYNKHTSLSIINKSKPFNCDTSNTAITFSLNDNMYRINRVFHELKDSKNKDIKRLFSKKVELYMNDELIKTGANTVNKWVVSNICSIQDFLLSSLITQNFDQDFFKFKPGDQMATLDTYLKMENINHLSNLLKDSKKEYSDLRNHILTYLNANLPTKYSEKTLEDIQDNISNIAYNKKELSVELNSYQTFDTNFLIDLEDDYVPTLSNIEVTQEDDKINLEINKSNIIFDEYVIYNLECISDPYKYIEQDSSTNFTSREFSIQELKTDIKVLLSDLTKSKELYDIMFDNIRHHLDKKPLINVSRLEYKEFIMKYNKYKNEYEHFIIPECLDTVKNLLDHDFERIEYDKHLLNESIDDLEKMVKDDIVIDIGDKFSFNHDCWACKKNFTKKQNVLNTIDYLLKQKQRNEYVLYIKNKEGIDTYHLLKSEKELWDSLSDKLDKLDDWNDKKKQLDTKLLGLNETNFIKQRLFIEAYNYQLSYNKLCILHEKKKDLVLDKQLYFNYRKKLQIKLDNIVLEERDAYVELSKLQIDNSNNRKFVNEQETHNILIETLTNRIELFEHFMNTLKVYKTWIYEEKLLPIIIDKTNTLLGIMFSQRLLKLQYRLIENHIYYSIIDEGNEINIEKLSGAQSFAVSMSFRLALSSIGISKVSCKQLFIDEGFCSYDENNLSQIPFIMKSIKSMYDSVLLVSHLEDIKNCADKTIQITRHKGISNLYN